MYKTIKKKVRQFIKNHKLFNVSYEKLKVAIEKEGYQVIEFNSVNGDASVEIIIKNLNLENVRTKSRGFTYCDGNYRLIFVNEDMNEEEKRLVLAHEIGHIVCGHYGTPTVIGADVKDEYEANEFVHYLLQSCSVWGKICKMTYVYKKMFVSVVVILSLILSFSAVYVSNRNSSRYTDSLYITSSGKSYHRKDCIFVKNKNNVQKLSKKSFDSNEYRPCGVCLPDHK